MTETHTERNEAFSENVSRHLKAFQNENAVNTKGPLSVVVLLTRTIKNKAFPLKAEDFQTPSKGQVRGLSNTRLKKILEEYGITRQLSSEAGRTNRGSMGLMMAYVDFLNEWAQEETVDLNEVERFWVEEVRQFFNNQPFILAADASKTLRANFDDLFEQAKKREHENKGTHYLGAMLQHLVAAKLQVVLPAGSFEIHGASVADSVTDRAGDFVINNTIIHCTTMPGDLLMEKCKRNLTVGARPVIITIYDRVHTTMTMLEDADLSGRVEVWDIQQFLSSNVLEHSLFADESRNTTLAEIIECYNAIIDEVETDPSLKISFDVN